MKKFTCNSKIRLRDFTDLTYPQGSFAFASLLRRGDVRVNGIKTRSDVMLRDGDEVTYYTTAAEEDKPFADIVYKDEDILVADKYSGVSSEGLFCALKDVAPCPVHRLDRNTCGLIVLARDEESAEILKAAFRDRKVSKVYLCFAKNCFSAKSGTLTGYLVKDGQRSLVRVRHTPCAGALKIVTEYEVLKEYGDYALVRVILHTGRTHQIRAHLASMGCPVLGDEKYGDSALNAKYHARRQILVSKSITLNAGGKLSRLDGRTFESRFSPVLPKS